MSKIKKFVKARDKAFLSMDVKKIRKFAEKYNIPCPGDDIVVMAGAAKAIRHISSATQEQKAKAEKWLLDNGFGLEI